MKIKRLYYPLLITALFLHVACEAPDNDKLPTGPTTKPSTPQITDKNNTNKNPSTTEAWTRLEFPHVSNNADNIVLIRSTNDAQGINYSIEWDKTKRAQRWTCYQMHSGNSGTSWNRNNWAYTDNQWAQLNYKNRGFWDPFQPDPDLPEGVRTELNEYDNIGYQRGHICPSADRLYSKDANEQTFYLSNMHPQSKALNTGTWEDMESQLRSWNKSSFRDILYVCKGGTIKDGQIKTTTRTRLIVPKYFFMAILCKKDNTYKALGFWIEHRDSYSKSKLRTYVTTIDDLQKKTGIDFFCNLPDEIENKVEAETNPTEWNL